MVSFDEKGKFEMARAKMVDVHLKGRGIYNKRVLEAMGTIERKEFVSGQYAEQAYHDNPLPIGMGQTISQPYIVALMTQELDVQADNEILEIGTGCGYQTAILAKLCKKVYTIERLAQLSETAQANLGRVGIDNVEFFVGDGTKGWAGEKQFDRILISAAAGNLPGPLVKQLKSGGKLIAPVGGETFQELVLGIKNSYDKLEVKNVCGVRFVKLIGEYGWDQ